MPMGYKQAFMKLRKAKESSGTKIKLYQSDRKYDGLRLA